jgi:AcrR family transcriptional regulator
MVDTRARLVAAAAELFRRSGFNGTALKDVTSTAEATTGSLYHFFPGGKSELAAAVLTETGAAYQQLFEVIAEEAAGPVEAVVAFFDGAADVLAEIDYIDVCPIGTVAREVASTDDRVRIAADDVFRSWTGAAATRFTAAGIPTAEADQLATTVVAALEGGFILARARRDGQLLRTIGEQMGQLVANAVAAVQAPA